MTGRSVAPALAMGNAVVLKPAEDTSLSALHLAKLAAEAGFPAGSLNVVTGLGEEAGAALAAHKGIHHISFTGSREVGTLIQAAAAKNTIPVTLEQLQKADRKAIRAAFDQMYERRYANNSPTEPVELVNIRLIVVGKRPHMNFPTLPNKGQPKPTHRRDVYFGDATRAVSSPVYRRADLGPDVKLQGPALIQERGTTTVLFEGDTLTMAPSGEMIISVGGK